MMAKDQDIDGNEPPTDDDAREAPPPFRPVSEATEEELEEAAREVDRLWPRKSRYTW